MHFQVRANSQTKGLERGWKQGAILGRDASHSYATISLLILRKKTTVLQSTKYHWLSVAVLIKRGENGVGGGGGGVRIPLEPSPRYTFWLYTSYMGDGNVTESSFSIV